MKKLVSICFAFVLLTCAAGAAHVGTIDNGYPGDTEAQAQMLCDLGLFRGTENGFELEKPMTRVEAAAMLTRFFGAEQEALADDWSHPFTDVPDWADKYVGWLYENGLTKGVSETAYGAQENVTCGQYCTFLARASHGEDNYDFLISDYGEQMLADCDAVGFVRGDAVSLSAYLLGQDYSADTDIFGISVAQHLIDRGVFTVEQLKEAAWDVLPRAYQRNGIYGTGYSGDEAISCVIAGVPVVRCPDERLYDMYSTAYNQVYGELLQEEQDYCLYRLDPLTLEPEELLRAPWGSSAQLLGHVPDGTDYILFWGADRDENIIYAIRGTELTPTMNLNNEQAKTAGFCCVQGENGFVFQTDENSFYRVGADGIEQLPLPEGDDLWSVLSGGLLLMENITPERTVISGWTWDGQPAGSFTVRNQYPVPDNLDAESQDYWCSQYAPKMLRHQNGLAWGTAGLYRVENGKLVQITDMPVYDCEIDPADGSYVVTTSAVDERPGYYGGGIYFLAGNEIKRIAADGTQTELLSNQPAHGLTFSEITYADTGTVRVQYTYVMGMSDFYQYEYAVEDGKLRALVHEYGEGGFSGYTAEEQQREQARLDELGVGVNAP